MEYIILNYEDCMLNNQYANMSVNAILFSAIRTLIKNTPVGKRDELFTDIHSAILDFKRLESECGAMIELYNLSYVKDTSWHMTISLNDYYFSADLINYEQFTLMVAKIYAVLYGTEYAENVHGCTLAISDDCSSYNIVEYEVFHNKIFDIATKKVRERSISVW